MKCPKCYYISFDHNQVCPKCNKDIAEEQRKLNLPAFRLAPPALLGALTGEASDSNIGLRVEDTGDNLAASQGAEFTPEDSQAIEAMEEAFQDSEGIEMQVDATPEAGLHFSEKEGQAEISSELEDLVLDDSELALPKSEEADEEEVVSFDLDDLSEDETVVAFDGEADAAGEKETETEFVESLPDMEMGPDVDEISLESETVAVESVKMPPATETGEEEDEISLDLDDLSIEDSEVESLEEKDLAVDVDDLLMDETVPEEKADPRERALDTGELLTSEIDMKKMKDSEEVEELDLELDEIKLDDK
jgi:hypothetical protein